MKTLGLVGGMSWVSTALYYQLLNEGVASRLGGLHSADLLLASVDFAPIAAMQREGRWRETGTLLASAAKRLEAAGARAIVLATNTMHKVAETIEGALKVPFLHIADATGAAIRAQGLRRPALLATAFTMEESFYKGRLEERFGLEVRIPDKDERADAHRIIFDELCRNIVREESRRRYETIAQRLIDEGADGIIAGCTEIGLLLNETNVAVPLFDTSRIHAESALTFMLSDEHPAKEAQPAKARP